MTNLAPLARGGLACLLLAAGFLSGQGCTDVGDSSAIVTLEMDAAEGEGIPSDDAAASAPVDEDAGGAFDAAESGDASASIGDEGGSSEASTSSDAGDGADAIAPPDATVADTGAPVDAGGPDATTSTDAGAQDASPLDARADGPAEASAPDASASDASSGPPPTLAPCTSASQTACVACQYNDGKDGTLPNAAQLCTPTEAALVAQDIAAGRATAPGPDPDASCYACAALSGCLDDSEFNDQGHECEDLAAPAAAACEATIACVLKSGCGAVAVSACYCGTAPVSGSCAAVGATNGANGTCATQEAAGLSFPVNDGLDILKSFTSTTLPSGVANNIFQCAASNGCTACLQ